MDPSGLALRMGARVLALQILDIWERAKARLQGLHPRRGSGKGFSAQGRMSLTIFKKGPAS
jgi:hypothetical protein